MTPLRLTRSALVLLTALAATSTVGCAPEVPSGQGPALVTVTKTPATPAATVPVGKVTRMTEPDGDDIRWDATLREMWVPAGSSVSPGAAETADGSGWVFIDVPAPLDVAADALSRRQLTAFPDTVVTRVADPDGVVMTRSLRNVTYTMSATADPEAPDQTVVMVRWDAVVAVG